MCGITVLWAPKAKVGLATSIRAATDTLANRGPDGDGVWIDADAGLALGHRRLAVVDLTEAGRQPMLSRDGRFCLTFNGEIYNFQDIRGELQTLGHDFVGHSDTEVMLAAFVQWGLEAALSKFIGMFAFALWDRQDRKLFLCRDRLGKKPLYFGWIGGCFAVASQLKAMKVIPGFRANISRLAFSEYGAKGYVPAPLSIYEDIYKLSPGSFLIVDLPTVLSSGKLEDWNPKVKKYWDADTVVAERAQHRYPGSEDSAASELLALLNDAVRVRMIADVPIGAFLSGGIDSSLIAALMQRNSSSKVKTYTIGYSDGRYDESAAAVSMARSIGTDHTAINLSASECQQVVPDLPEVFDEPFADPSAIPTLLVSHYARKEVTVVLSGDGGDELFGGYNRHVWLPRIWRLTAWLPFSLRSALGKTMGGLPLGMLPTAMKVLSAASGDPNEPRLAGDKLTKVAAVLGAANFRDAYERLTNVASASRNSPPSELSARTGRDLDLETRYIPSGLSEAEQLMYLDMTMYLVDDVLVKVDRATMAYSLEARAPFLDHRVAEFAWSLPSHMKVQGIVGKKILRRLRTELIPSEPTERAKMGFAIPIGDWLRGPLYDWASELLNPERIRSEGYFDAEIVSFKWDQHLKRRASNEYELWGVLMFNAWLSSNRLH
jgi:asparagine synthase (glutamine-hydrolysing)